MNQRRRILVGVAFDGPTERLPELFEVTFKQRRNVLRVAAETRHFERDNVHQRVKCERYGDAIFFVTRMPSSGSRYESEQVSLILVGNVVITFQERKGDCLDAVRRRIEGSEGRIRSRGADYLFYAILDRIIDEYFPVLERYDERLSKISNTIARRAIAFGKGVNCLRLWLPGRLYPARR